MAQYDNNRGWEASQRTRNYWRFIPMQNIKFQGFEMPPLFKQVNPLIKWMILGFLSILALELYATFGVAVEQGIPIEVIAILLFVDIFLAVIPHFLDGKRTDLKNLVFIGEYSSEFLQLEDYEKKKYEAKYIHNENRLRWLTRLKWTLYIPIVISGAAKLYLFFRQYPLYNTYEAWVVIISYFFGCVLHILCTGSVIMYWRFVYSLNRDKNAFAKSNGVRNKTRVSAPKLIYVKAGDNFNLPKETLLNQKIIITDNKYYIHFEGVLFDEEINYLISHQTTLKQQIAVALTGKIIQLSLLDRGINI